MQQTVPGAGPRTAKRRLSSALSTSRRFGLLLLAMARDICRRFPGGVIRILLAAGLSLACQAAVLLVLFKYMNALETQALLLGYPARTSVTLFVLVAGAVLLLFVGFSLMEYRANLAAINLSREYQNQGTGEALSLFSRLPHWFNEARDPHISVRHMRQILAIDVHHLSRMCRVLMLAIIPAARLLLCAFGLFYIDPQFSALIILAVGVPVAGLYSVGRRVADTITSREAQQPQLFQHQKQLLADTWAQEESFTAEQVDWEVTLGDSESRFRQYFRRLRAKAHGLFLVNVANGLGIMVLIMALGVGVLTGKQGEWSLWLTYLIALRYFLSSLSTVARTVVKSTRYIRQVERFSNLMAAAGLAAASADPAASPCPASVAAAYGGDGDTAILDDDDDED